MMLNAVDDMIENCLMDNGLFYYKELPALIVWAQPLILEALTIAYELTGDSTYLTYGKRTFKCHQAPAPSVSGIKIIIEDAVIHKTNGTKNFAQTLFPIGLLQGTHRLQPDLINRYLNT